MEPQLIYLVFQSIFNAETNAVKAFAEKRDAAKYCRIMNFDEKSDYCEYFYKTIEVN